MASRADLLVYDRNGRLTATAEVKNKRATSRLWAAQFLRNMLAHGSLQPADYFLLVTPDRVYLWKDVGTEPMPVEPDYEVDAESIFKPYLSKAGIHANDISGRAFELVVVAWLSDLTRSGGVPKEAPDEQAWQVESGLLGALRDGLIEYAEAA